MITITSKGKFSTTERYLERIKEYLHLGILDKYGTLGVEALQKATPKDSGKTSSSWTYSIEHKGDVDTIVWSNSNINDGVNIAVILQYGHGTGTGGYVKGTDYINPALKPIFDGLANSAWEEVTRV